MRWGVVDDGGVRIRPFAVSDADALFEAAVESYRELSPWMPWCHSGYCVHEARSWVLTQVAAFQAETEYEFAIVTGCGDFLGGCGLNGLDHENRRANMGYWVRTPATNRGVATAALRLLVDWALTNTEFERLEVVVASGNAASQRVAEKAGALREGLLRRRLQLHGRGHDAYVFSFLR